MIASLTRLWTATVFALLLAGCGPFFDEIAEHRSLYAKQADGPVVIAVVDGGPETGFVNGVRLAIAEIDAAEGGILGRPLELIVRPGADSFSELRPVVQRIASDPRVTAALGHPHPGLAVPASVIYEQSRVLFMPAFDATEELTRHGFNFVLRMLPDASTMAAQTASVATILGYRRVVVLHQVDDYDREAAFLFEDLAKAFGIEVPFQGSFFSAQSNYRRLINEFGQSDFDAIFLAADTESGARMLRQLRELGIRKPVLGSLKLNLGPLAELSKDAGELTIVPTVLSSEGNNPLRERFAHRYVQTFGIEPDQHAAQGFDSVQILAEIIRRTGSTEPRAVANTAHFSGPMAGVTGIYAFDEAGNLHGNRYSFQVLRYGRWEPLPGIDLPFLLRRFETGTDPADEVTRALVLAQPERDRLPPTQNGEQIADRDTATATDRSKLGGPGGAASPFVTGLQSVPAVGITHQMPHQPRTIEHTWSRERDLRWLAIAHRILGFKRLGLVVEPSDSGAAAAVTLARAGSERLGFEFEVCEIAEVGPPNESPGGLGTVSSPRASRSEDLSVDTPNTRRAHTATLACYHQLASTVDAVYVHSGVDVGDLRQITGALRRMGVSSFAINDVLDADDGLTLALNGRSLALNGPSMATRLNGLMKPSLIPALEREISAVPSLSLNLRAFDDLGLSPSPLSLALVSNLVDETPPGPEDSSIQESQR
ncbi:MAG: ABC transporter substrate-binding protein [Thiohalocapsa sp.]